jgi:hypothetical protein
MKQVLRSFADRMALLWVWLLYALPKADGPPTSPGCSPNGLPAIPPRVAKKRRAARRGRKQ